PSVLQKQNRRHGGSPLIPVLFYFCVAVHSFRNTFDLFHLCGAVHHWRNCSSASRMAFQRKPQNLYCHHRSCNCIEPVSFVRCNLLLMESDSLLHWNGK